MVELSSNLQRITLGNVHRLKELVRIGRGTINRIVWSRDGKTIGVAGSLGAWLYDANDLNTEPRLFPHPYPVNCIALSPSGNLLATGGGSNVKNEQRDLVCFWEVESGRRLGVLRGHEQGITNCAFNPEGTVLVSSSHDDTVRVWDVDTRILLHVLNAGAGWVMDVGFSNNGNLLATANYHGAVIIWDAHSGKIVNRFEHYGRLWAVAISPDGRLVASSSSDERTIRLWDTSGGNEIMVLRHLAKFAEDDHPDFEYPMIAQQLLFSQDGTKLVSGAFSELPSDGLRVFDTKTGKPNHEFFCPSSVSSIALNPENTLLATSTHSTLSIYDAISGEVKAVYNCHSYPIYDMALTQDEGLLAYATSEESVTGKVYTWDIQQRLTRNVLNINAITKLAMSPDGHTIAALSFMGSQTLGLFDTTTGEEITTFKSNGVTFISVVVSSDNKLIAAVGHEIIPSKTQAPKFEGRVFIWDSKTYAEIAVLKSEMPRYSCVAISNDNCWVAAGGNFDSRAIHLWKLSTGESFSFTYADLQDVHHLCFTHDCSQLIAINSQAIYAWDVMSKTLIYNISVIRSSEERLNPLCRFAVSRDGHLLAIGHDDGQIGLWEISKGMSLGRIHEHTAFVTALAFVSDDRLLISSSVDGTIRYWGIGE